SYRTIQRFFAKDICWPSLNWSIMKASFGDSSGVVLVAGDATTAAILNLNIIRSILIQSQAVQT
ncbi:MAG: hypothetical protein D3910_11125, partial [Candidatus Electrothrix sp. ATG2]|nr:hypothetical protein [Candidatus Electrothrix sp. ATG2]